MNPSQLGSKYVAMDCKARYGTGLLVAIVRYALIVDVDLPVRRFELAAIANRSMLNRPPDRSGPADYSTRWCCDLVVIQHDRYATFPILDRSALQFQARRCSNRQLP